MSPQGVGGNAGETMVAEDKEGVEGEEHSPVPACVPQLRALQVQACPWEAPPPPSALWWLEEGPWRPQLQGAAVPVLPLLRQEDVWPFDIGGSLDRSCRTSLFSVLDP